MKISFINCSNGISGDMILSSFISAGVNPNKLEEIVKKNLGISGWRLEVGQNKAIHFPVTTLNVKGNIVFKSPQEMCSIIRKSTFSNNIRKKGLAILDTLIEAESKVHKIPLKGVHFHELNSIDTLIDIIGSCLCADILKVDKVFASSVNLGSAMPATLEIVKKVKIPVFSSDPSFEMTTPTGAAIISELASGFGDMPLMKIERLGFGSGTKKSSNGYSVMKIFIGEAESLSSYMTDETILLETNIDDMDPRIYPYVMERLFSSGARDVWFTQVLMKKGRPGIVLSVLCIQDTERKLLNVLFKETTTLGIRRLIVPRYVLERKINGKNKVAFIGKGKTKTKSEFEKVKKKALETGQPLFDMLT